MSNSKASNKTKGESLTLNIKDNLQDIFQYKKAYEVHVRKLSEIRNVRKNHLKTNTHRNFQIQHIKDIKHNNFMYKLNQEAMKIEDDNLKLFDKLNREMSASRSTNLKEPISMKARKSMDMTASYNKNVREKFISKQNKRLKQRIKSSYSFLNSSKLLDDQKMRQKIKDRISKFTNTQLKSQRYFSAMSSRSQRQNSLSCRLSENKRKNNSQADPTIQSTNLNKKSIKITSFYNPRQVIMNKIQNFGNKFRIFNKFQEQDRPKTTASFKLSKKYETSNDKNNKSFFPTQAY